MLPGAYQTVLRIDTVTCNKGQKGSGLGVKQDACAGRTKATECVASLSGGQSIAASHKS